MENLFLWLGFIGSWLLFAGPIYQAALELQDEDIEVDRIRAAGSKVQTVPKTSAWWWVIPPVKFYKELRREKQNRTRIVKVLSHEDVEALISFNSKATAWLFIAAGGFCIACKESYELAEHNEWGSIILVLLIIGMLGLSIANLIYRVKRAERIKNL